MKSTLKLALVFMILLVYRSPVGAQSGDCLLSVNRDVVPTDTIHIRVSPDFDSIDAMPGLGDSPVELLAASDGWYFVERDGLTGYVRQDSRYPYMFDLSGDGCRSLPTKSIYDLENEISRMPAIPTTCNAMETVVIPSTFYIPVYAESPAGFEWVGTFESNPPKYVPGRNAWYADWLSIPLTITKGQGVSPTNPVIMSTGDGGLRNGGIEYTLYFISVIDGKLSLVYSTTDGGMEVSQTNEFVASVTNTLGTWGVDKKGNAFFSQNSQTWIKMVNTALMVDPCA